jgi:hypothetical protein
LIRASAPEKQNKLHFIGGGAARTVLTRADGCARISLLSVLTSMQMIAAILGLWLASQSTVPSLTGRVTTSDGQPVPGAAVITQHFNAGGGYGSVESKTLADGQFSLAAGGKVLFVRKSGYVPTSRILASDQDDLQVIMEPVSDARTMRVLACKDTYGFDRQTLKNSKLWPKGAQFYGDTHLYPVPQRLRVEDHNDIDYAFHVVFFPKGKKNRMLIHSGSLWGAYYPDLHFFENVMEFTERALGTGENAEEIQGTLKNGHKFRWLGGATSEISYYDVTPEAAAFFDRIIDQGCILN